MTIRRLRLYLADLVHDYLPGNYVLPLNIGLVGVYLKHQFGSEVDIKLFKSPSHLSQALKG